MDNFKLGCIITDQYEPTNYNFKVLKDSLSQVASAPLIPLEFKNTNYKILDQGNVGSCVAHSIAQNRIVIENKQLNENNLYSTDFIYLNRKPTDYQGEGMIVEEALNTLTAQGIALYQDLPTNTAYSNKPLNFEQTKQQLSSKAIPHKISSYYQIKNNNLQDTINDVKYSVINFGGALITVDVRQSFMNAIINNKGKICDADIAEASQGGHAMWIIGYDKYCNWIVANSWSEKYGDNGLIYIPMTCNIIKQYFVLIDNYKDKEIGNLKYILSMFNTDSADELRIKGLNSILGMGDKIKYIKSTDDKSYYYYDVIHNTREEAVNAKSKLSCEGINIIPISIKSSAFHIVFNDPGLDDWTIDYLNKNKKEDFQKDFVYKRLSYNGKAYISIIQYNSKDLADKMLAILKTKSGYGECFVIEII